MSEFAQNLKSHHFFEDVFDEENYAPLPADWLIIATDIKGSTKAIEAGRYKDVNTLGATCIISCINACKGQQICFQFGGDGALVAAPQDCLPQINKALYELSLIASSQFELSLRLCIWKVSDFIQAGFDFKVLKHDLTPGQSVYMFAGSGVAASDDWMKNEAKARAKNLYSPPQTELSREFVEGLECRWNPLQSKNGQMVTGLIKVREGKNASKIFRELHLILDKGLNSEAAHSEVNRQSKTTEPVRLETLPTRWPPKDYVSEWKVKTAGENALKAHLAFIKVLGFLMFLTPIVWLFKNKIPFLSDLALKSDFQKYDGMYRFVRDLSDKQLAEIKTSCETLFLEGKIYYGIHESDTALMTCMVWTQEDHIHFIDGGDGGYAMAAKQLKSQMSGEELS